MTLNLSLSIKGNNSYERYLKEFPKITDKAAKLAINETLDKGRTMAKREILSEINFPKSYLDGKSKSGRRLDVRKTDQKELSGAIVARTSPTSLSRFLEKEHTKQSGKGRNVPDGVTVKVSSKRKRMKKAFVRQLRSGNRGIAIRLPKGETPAKKQIGKPLYSDRWGDVYLLYGPSVQQAFINNQEKGVARDIRPKLEQFLNKEFLRQMGRLKNA